IAFLAEWNPTLGVATGRDVLTAGELRAHGGNRKGYAGYEHEPWWTEFTLSGTPPTGVPNAEAGPLMQLARHRFYRADLGTWTRRDPLGYVDSLSLYNYVLNQPFIRLDPFGLCASCSTGSSIRTAASTSPPYTTTECLDGCFTTWVTGWTACVATFTRERAECMIVYRGLEDTLSRDGCLNQAYRTFAFCMGQRARRLEICRQNSWHYVHPLFPPPGYVPNPRPRPTYPEPTVPIRPTYPSPDPFGPCDNGVWVTECFNRSDNRTDCVNCCMVNHNLIIQCGNVNKGGRHNWPTLAAHLNTCVNNCKLSPNPRPMLPGELPMVPGEECMRPGEDNW
ncbi:MAG: hypothetical protein KF768_13925, partial [Phycisphaeraceae bacterium]|nr:hypothetical protein [Phycisphaeraceae bacterium]